MTQIDLNLTWLVNGTMKSNSPSQSDATNLDLSNRSSNDLNTVLPEPAVSSFKHLTLSMSMMPTRSLASSAPTYSTHPQAGPCTCCIYLTYNAIFIILSCLMTWRSKITKVVKNTYTKSAVNFILICLSNFPQNYHPSSLTMSLLSRPALVINIPTMEIQSKEA